MAYPGLRLGPRRHVLSTHGDVFELASPSALFLFTFGVLETEQGRGREVVSPTAESLDESTVGGVRRGRRRPQSNPQFLGTAILFLTFRILILRRAFFRFGLCSCILGFGGCTEQTELELLLFILGSS